MLSPMMAGEPRDMFTAEFRLAGNTFCFIQWRRRHAFRHAARRHCRAGRFMSAVIAAERAHHASIIGLCPMIFSLIAAISPSPTMNLLVFSASSLRPCSPHAPSSRITADGARDDARLNITTYVRRWRRRATSPRLALPLPPRQQMKMILEYCYI